MRCKNFLKVHENTGEKFFTKIYLCRWLFGKNNTTINYGDNGDLFPDTSAFAFIRQPIKRNFTWSAGAITESICIAAGDHAKIPLVFKRWGNCSILCESCC